MGWNGTFIDGINTKMAGNATGSLQQALGSSQDYQAKLFEVEQGKDDRWARFRPVKSWKTAANADVASIHARAGTMISWPTAYGKSPAPGEIGSTNAFQKYVGSTQRNFITAWGLDVPIVTSANGKSDVIAGLFGQAGCNWNKTAEGSWQYLRAMDFDGYKPTATFPAYYSVGDGRIPNDAPEFGIGIGHQLRDPYRIFLGDLGEYAFNNKLYWAVIIKRTSGAVSYSPIIWQDANGNSFLMSAYDEMSTIPGVNRFNIPTAYFRGVDQGTTYNIYVIGYDPTRDIAVLLPNGGGTNTTNPMSYTVTASANDPLRNLTFNMKAGGWGLTNGTPAWNSLLPFPVFAGGIFQDCYGLTTTSTLFFSVTFRNPGSSDVTFATGNIRFRCSIYNIPASQQGPWSTTALTPVVYQVVNNSLQTVSGNITINAGTQKTLYFRLDNVWTGLSPTGSNAYADMLMFRIEYGSNPPTYPDNDAFVFATTASKSGGPKLSCTFDLNTFRMAITSGQPF